jgi:hypothetical protein
MAITLEFIDFIIPIRIIEAKYKGGWAQCLRDHAPLIGGRVWYDDNLFRDGAMNPADIKALAEFWEGLGFNIIRVEQDGSKHFHDACVVEWRAGGATLPCDWIECCKDEPVAFLKGQPVGAIIGREGMVVRTT